MHFRLERCRKTSTHTPQGSPMETKDLAINRRSANITEGKSRAPNRSMYYAMGYE